MVGIENEALSALSHGALVITANERSARGLRRAYDRLRQASGADAWEPPAVQSWTAWCDSMWRYLLLAGRTHALLLNPLQEQALWTRIIAQDSASIGSAAGRLAEISARAWRALGSYRGQAHVQRAAGPGSPLRTVDTDAFARWSAAFVRRCREDALLSQSMLEDALADAFDAGDLTSEHRRLLLVGFDDLLPAQQRLLQAARRATSPAEIITPADPAANTKVVCAPDAIEELRACARWCREKHAAGLRVAIILADPESERPALGRVLREALSENTLPDLQNLDAFDFPSAGPLAQQPMIVAALNTLRLAAGAIPLDHASGLLLSRYFAANFDPSPDRDREPAGDPAAIPGLVARTHADESERTARAEFDAFELRNVSRLRPEIGLPTLLRETHASRRRTRLPILLNALRKLEREIARPAPLRRGYGDWAETMRRLLAASGWGAQRGAETPAELHLQETWDGVLDELATLDFAAARVTFDDALITLTHAVEQRVLSVAPTDAPIAILSPRDAAGSAFDAIWCLRAGEASWPRHTASHPLIPWPLQHDLQMPGTDRARDAKHLAETFARLRASAPEIVFSYPAHFEDVTQRAAAGLREMKLEEIDAATIAPPLDPRHIASLESVTDIEPLASLPDRVQPGGAEILQAQAACAFRAFAEHRLWSTSPRDIGLGLDRGRRGTVVHQALEHLWTEIKGQTQLRALTATERHAVIARASSHALARSLAQRAIAWDEAYLEVQRDRLHHLLDLWLDLELRRPDFTVELQERVLRDAQIGPLRLELRIDRVDKAGDTEVLIDYKTGRAEPQQWSGDRPDAPQLPLYAVLSAGSAPREGQPADTHLGAVAFASVHAGEKARLYGFAERGGLLPGTGARMEADTFAAQIDRWRDVLEQLAREFTEGSALVRPKLYPATCRTCRQRVLCRLDAAALEEPEEDPDDVEELDLG